MQGYLPGGSFCCNLTGGKSCSRYFLLRGELKENGGFVYTLTGAFWGEGFDIMCLRQHRYHFSIDAAVLYRWKIRYLTTTNPKKDLTIPVTAVSHIPGLIRLRNCSFFCAIFNCSLLRLSFYLPNFVNSR